jgi:hypothetical protein
MRKGPRFTFILLYSSYFYVEHIADVYESSLMSMKVLGWKAGLNCWKAHSVEEATS